METINSSKQILSSKLFWTGSKTDLIELIYALNSSDDINNGVADIKEVAVIYKQIFNIDLGNYYQKFIKLKLSRISFFESLSVFDVIH